MALPTKNLKYTVGMDIVTNYKHKTNHWLQADANGRTNPS